MPKRGFAWLGRHKGVTVLLLLLLAGAAVPAFVALGNRSHSSPYRAQDVTPSSQASRAPKPAAPTPGPSTVAASSGCRRNPLANVYHRDRLRVLAACTTVTGTIHTIKHEPDGDYHIDLRPDAAFAGLVNDANRRYQHGDLVLEIVPADEAGCIVGKPPKPATGTYDYGICTGAALVVPPLGAHVAVTGPYVLDRAHGWNEIHPVWVIKVISLA